MSPPLPTTRLHFPQARTNLIPRPRLLEKLMALESPGHRLGLISAPAGFGKTTLVLQWLAQRQACPACWVSLDARDSQPAAFFTHLISALQTIFPGAGRPALDLLSLPGVSLEEVVTLLVNGLAEAGSSFALILDDFHHITDALILQALDLLPDVQPPQMRLLLLTREDPALQLALHRAPIGRPLPAALAGCGWLYPCVFLQQPFYPGLPDGRMLQISQIDQPRLHSTLTRIRDLNLVLVSVVQSPRLPEKS